MFKTEFSETAHFDWDEFFCNENGQGEMNKAKIEKIIRNCRKHLAYNPISNSMEFNRMVKALTQGLFKNSIKILEIGAGTGVLTRCLLMNYGGTGVLVDKNENAFNRYQELMDPMKAFIDYRQHDLFAYSDKEEYDITCSFGVIEHFIEKDTILECHKRFLKQDGYVMLFIPLDSPLTRAYYEVFPELNQGYRELLTEKELSNIVSQNGLKLVRTSKSRYQSYDFIGIVCSVMKQ